jgi:hypothetical protein
VAIGAVLNYNVTGLALFCIGLYKKPIMDQKDQKTTKDIPAEMPVSAHPAAKKVDADPHEEKAKKEEGKITLQSQKGKKVDADPTTEDGKPTKE